MRLVFIMGLILASSLVQAQDLCKQNSIEILNKKIKEAGLLDIFWENRTTLMKMEVGMSAIVDDEGLEARLSDNHDLVSEEQKRRLKKTILRLEGTKAYILWEDENLITGEKSRYVMLDQMDLTKNPPRDVDSINFVVDGDKLTMFEQFMDEWDSGREEIRSKTIINLKEPQFCSGNYFSEGTHTNLNLNKSVKISNQSKTRCIENEPKTNLLKLDLSSIEFCDGVTNPQDINCEQRDLSFITKQMAKMN